MVYECEKCGTALPADVLKCPKCGEGFDEAVPQDAEVTVRDWQPKSEASGFSPSISQATFFDQSTPTASKPKRGQLTPGRIILAIICWPVGLIWIIVYIWKHPTWVVKTKLIFIGLVVATVLIIAETINFQEGNNPLRQQNTEVNSATIPSPVQKSSPKINIPLAQPDKVPVQPIVKQAQRDTPVADFFATIDDDNASKVNRMLTLNPKLIYSLDSQNPGFGSPPLIHALDKIDIVRVLLNHGANVNATGDMQSGSQTALHFACHDGTFEIAKLLISRGANVNARTPEGKTPLYLVSMEPDTGSKAQQCKIADLLIRSGADVEARDNIGETPLIEAAFYTRLDIAKILINHGASINAKTSAGTTALDMVKDLGAEVGNKEMQAYLRRHGATEGQ